MAFESPGNIWDFRLARRLLQSFPYSDQSSGEKLTLKSDSSFNPRSAIPTSLGDFNRLYQYLNLPLDPPSLSPESTASSSSGQSEPYFTSDSTAPDDVPSEVARLDEAATGGKEVRWKDEVPGGLNLTESRRRSADRRRSVIASILADDSDQGDNEGTPTPASRRSKRRKDVRQAGTAKIEGPALNSTFLPLSIQPKHSDNERHTSRFSLQTDAYLEKHSIRPLYTLTRAEQEVRLIKKVQRLIYTAPTTKGVHIFVDCSNIIIGHINRLKLDRGIKGSVKAPLVSFQSLAYILERGRRVDRRILAGSQNTAYIRGSGTYLPSYMKEAKKLGYELNVLERVVKPQVKPTSKARHGQGNGYATTSGHSSGEDIFTVGALTQAEQAVDELLQMKMLESLLDYEPATVVLASGDAAEAEYSGGFLKSVERALRKGWKVEIVAWKNGLSYEYRSTSFLSRWEGRFRVIELDDFSEEMLGYYSDLVPTEQALC